MAKKTFEVALLLTAKDEATKIIAAASARQRQIMAMSERGDRAFATGRQAGSIGLAIAGALALPIKAAADMETLNMALRSSFQGNAKAAKEAFGEINKFAAQTPFELNEVVTSFLRLKNAGLDPSVKALEAYGNIASSTPGKTLMDFTEAVGDAVMGENERLKEFNISAKKSGDLVSYTFQGITTTVKNNAKDIEKYLQYIGNVKYAGATIAQSKTFNGMISTLKDNVVMTAARLGDKMLPRMKEYADSLTKSVDKVAAWISNNQSLVGTILKVAAGAMALSLAVSAASFAFGGVFKIISFGMSIVKGYRALMLTVTAVQNAMAFSALAGGSATQILSAALKAANLAFLTSPIFWVVLAIAGSAFLIIKYWEPIKNFFSNLWSRIKAIFIKALDFIKQWGLLFLGPIGIIIKIWQLVPNKFKNIGSDIISGLWNGIKSKATQLFEFVKGIGKGVANAFKSVLGIASPSKVFMDYGVNITEGASKGIQKGQNNLKSTAGNMGKSIAPVGGKSGGGSGGGITVNFAPVISGGGSGQDIAAEIKKLFPQFMRELTSSVERKQKLSY